jgi:redox-sensing transcriptional repressor
MPINGSSFGSNTPKVFSEPTLRRLPIYHHYLKKIAEKGIETVSCTQIANDLNLISIQVRKDLEYTKAAGKPKLGYNVASLIKAIEEFLGWDNVSEAFLIGTGNLGTALLGYQGFRDYGLNIVAAFDGDTAKVDTEISGKRVFHIDRLPEMVKRMRIKLGILTVPAEAAQSVADLLVRSGIKGIWNFAPARIQVPEGIIVQHENLSSSLAVLSKKLAMIIKKKPEVKGHEKSFATKI